MMVTPNVNFYFTSDMLLYLILSDNISFLSPIKSKSKITQWKILREVRTQTIILFPPQWWIIPRYRYSAQTKIKQNDLLKKYFLEHRQWLRIFISMYLSARNKEHLEWIKESQIFTKGIIKPNVHCQNERKKSTK